jgi:DHA1 family multidrug resistance protein-like MFS transporter
MTEDATEPAPSTDATVAAPISLIGADSSEATWRINLTFIWVGVFVGLMGANFVFPFIPFYIKELGVTSESKVAFYTSLTASATGLSLTLTAPIWGALADRYGRKPMFLRALVGAGVLIAFMGLVQSVWQLVALRFLMGAFAGTMGAAAALVASTTPRAKVGYALGMLQTGQFTANMLGPVIGGIVAASLGIRESFIFCASLYLAAAFLVYWFVKERPASEQPVAPPAPEGRKSGGLAANLRDVVSERQVLFMLGLLFCLWLSTTFVRPVMPISIDNFSTDEHVHLSVPGFDGDLREEAATGLVFSVIGLTSTVAAFAVAPLGERLGYRNTVAVAAIMTGALYPTVALADGLLSFMLLLGAVGLFQGAMVPGTNALIAASAPEGKQGSAFGLAASMQSLALMLGPIGGGFATAQGGIGAVYVVIGVILLIAAVGCIAFVREPQGFGRRRRE